MKAATERIRNSAGLMVTVNRKFNVLDIERLKWEFDWCNVMCYLCLTVPAICRYSSDTTKLGLGFTHSDNLVFLHFPITIRITTTQSKCNLIESHFEFGLCPKRRNHRSEHMAAGKSIRLTAHITTSSMISHRCFSFVYSPKGTSYRKAISIQKFQRKNPLPWAKFEYEKFHSCVLPHFKQNVTQNICSNTSFLFMLSVERFHFVCAVICAKMGLMRYKSDFRIYFFSGCDSFLKR